jgi:O-antigen ligase
MFLFRRYVPGQHGGRMPKHRLIHFSPYDLPFILFLISAAASIWPAYNPSLGAKTILAYLLGALLYWVLSRLAVHRRGWHWAAVALAVFGALFAGLYITQVGHTGGDEKIGALARLARIIARFTPDLAFFKPDGNSAGTFLEGIIFLQAGLALRVQTRRWKIGLWAAVILTTFGLFMSVSRGAWTAVAAGVLLWAALYWKPARYLLIAGCLGLAGLVLWVALGGDLTIVDQVPVIGSLLGALLIRPDRLTVYYHSLAMLSEVPFTGIGLGGQFAMTYARYQLYLHVPFLYYSHNLFLEIWLEQGVLGIFAFLWLAASLFRNAWIYRSGQGLLRFEATWIGMVAILIHGLSDARQTQSLWCWLPLVGLLGLNAALITSQRVTETRALPRWLPAVAAALLVAGVWISAMPLAGSAVLNRASIVHHRADLAPGLSEEQRANLRVQAAEEFRQVLKKDSGNFGANHRLGMLALVSGNYEEAIDHLELALRRYPLHEGVRKMLGLAYAHHGDVEQAAVYLEGMLNIVQELNYYADYYEREGRPDLSRSFYQLSLIFQPDQPYIQQWLDAQAP